jgi:hypothetical protein
MQFASILRENPFEDWFGILCSFLPKSVNRGKFIKFTKYINKNLVHNLASLIRILKYYVKCEFVDNESKKLLRKVLKGVIQMNNLSYFLEDQLLKEQYSQGGVFLSEPDNCQLFSNGKIFDESSESDFYEPSEFNKESIDYFTNNYIYYLFDECYVTNLTSTTAKNLKSSYIEIFVLKNKLEKLVSNSFL